jgi:hypothetical protein
MRLVLFFLLSAVAASSVSCSCGQPGAPKGALPKEEAVVIFRAADGRTLTMADLQGLSGAFQYEILGKSNYATERLAKVTLANITKK